MTNQIIKRGDIFLCRQDNTFNLKKVFILQSENYLSKIKTVIVAKVIEDDSQNSQMHVEIPQELPLKNDSTINFDEIYTIKKEELSCYICSITEENIWKSINSALKKNLGLWYYTKRTSDIRCLCPRCLRNYINNASFLVKRVDSFQKKEEPCEKCGSKGYSYFVIDRRKSVDK